MRKDDWITKLYYKKLSGESRNNRDSRKTISTKKEISRTQDKLKRGKWSSNT